jgi:signal transduction histidine kinase
LEKKEKIKILYIDDEPHNLNSFKASFRFDYTIYTAVNTDEAVAQLDAHPDIRVILSDQRMPDKTGVQFFEEIRSKHPNPIRVLITGYADIESVIDAINLGNIFRYVKKPWTDTDIQSAIEESNKFYTATSMLAVKNLALQKAYDELNKFAYSVTHDMRGPLLSILGAIGVAKNVGDVNEMQDMLHMMESSVEKLDTFIQNTHEYYNLKQGELHIEELNMEKIEKDMQDIYSMTAKVSNVEFAVSVSQPEPFRSDEMAVKIVLNNLLSNAFKYQRKDEAHKKVDLNITVEKGNAIIFVKDNGIGIDSKHINDIFNMFYRATTEEVGSGIGLYNVKDALLKLNGEISVDSTPGVGTTFKVTIPSK